VNGVSGAGVARQNLKKMSSHPVSGKRTGLTGPGKKKTRGGRGERARCTTRREILPTLKGGLYFTRDTKQGCSLRNLKKAMSDPAENGKSHWPGERGPMGAGSQKRREHVDSTAR